VVPAAQVVLAALAALVAVDATAVTAVDVIVAIVAVATAVSAAATVTAVAGDAIVVVEQTATDADRAQTPATRRAVAIPSVVRLRRSMTPSTT
jgi:hypothetical protein